MRKFKLFIRQLALRFDIRYVNFLVAKWSDVQSSRIVWEHVAQKKIRKLIVNSFLASVDTRRIVRQKMLRNIVKRLSESFEGVPRSPSRCPAENIAWARDTWSGPLSICARARNARRLPSRTIWRAISRLLRIQNYIARRCNVQLSREERYLNQ